MIKIKKKIAMENMKLTFQKIKFVYIVFKF